MNKKYLALLVGWFIVPAIFPDLQAGVLKKTALRKSNQSETTMVPASDGSGAAVLGTEGSVIHTGKGLIPSSGSSSKDSSGSGGGLSNSSQSTAASGGAASSDGAAAAQFPLIVPTGPMAGAYESLADLKAAAAPMKSCVTLDGVNIHFGFGPCIGLKSSAAASGGSTFTSGGMASGSCPANNGGVSLWSWNSTHTEFVPLTPQGQAFILRDSVLKKLGVLSLFHFGQEAGGSVMVSACPNDHATPACGVTSSRNFIFADSPDAGLIKASSDAGNLSGGKVCVLDPKKDYYLNVWTNRSDWNSPTQCPRGCFNQVYMMVVPLLSR